MNPELRTSLTIATIILAMFAVSRGMVACSSSQAAHNVKTGLKVADDVCQEIAAADAGQPEWVSLVCQDVGAISGVATVLLPRRTWAAMKAHEVDAGPGK